MKIETGKSPLRIGIHHDDLVIAIGVDTLIHACEIGRPCGLGEITITDKDKFLSGVIGMLEIESEDGTTIVHEMFDKAVSMAIEYGVEGVSYDDD